MAGKVALVTGSTRGIGRAIATRFAAEGAAVVITGRTETSGRAVQEEIRAAGGEATYVRADFARLLQHRDRERLAPPLLLELRQAQGRRHARRAAPDDHHIDVEGFTLHLLWHRDGCQPLFNSATIAGTTSNRSPTMP